MSEHTEHTPFQSLGSRLKTIRQKLQESVADVSGAIEIDEEKLQRIEQGKERPSEDILLLLISHFGMREDEAANLWLLAGYDRPQSQDGASNDDSGGRPTIMLMGIDPRTMYSDSVQISVNPAGVTIGFSQSGPSSQPLAISRIGMSRDQAHNLLRVLGQALDQYDNPPAPKGLPHGTKKSDESK
ncbi:MAG TPA: helix-turn-helix domain-containing protein [Candidatus Saccharimonadales bacterium]|nr:helix-turn-helix domain-containing protein [Candidatus Saccharimonadales bacterium]